MSPEKLRFCASGTEATMYCQRVARGYTGRNKILKFEGAYHGADETGVTSLFPKQMLDYPKPEPTSAGVLDIDVQDVITIDTTSADGHIAITSAHTAAY